MPTSGASSQSSPSAVEPSSAGNAVTPTIGDQHGDDHDEPDRREERARQRTPGLARLLGQVGDGLEARVGEHRERQREGEVVPAPARSRGRSPLVSASGEKTSARPSTTMQQLHRRGRAARARARRCGCAVPDEPHADDRRRSRRPRRPRPTGSRCSDGAEARRRGSAAGRAPRARSRSGSRGTAPSRSTKPARSLNARRMNVAAPPVSGIAAVPSAYESETTRKSSPLSEQHDRGEPERLRRDDAEREVDRRADLAVGDGEQRAARRGRARSRGPYGPRLALQLDARDAERDEQAAEHEADARRRRWPP